MRGHLTADEHEWLGRDKSYDGVPARKGWIGTRFWFYPESIEIHAGEDDQSATIVRARYTADAERSRDDFNSDDDFERHRQAALLPSVRFVIDHLNANYEAYSAVFSELAELDTVARLVGICGWLAKRRPQWLDCDALLGVELPVSPTERERTRLITAALMMKSGAAASDEQNVISDSLAVNLSPLLDMPVREYFSSSADIGRCLGAEQATTPSGIAHSDSELLFTANADRPVREILRTHEDVERFASYASDRCEVPKSKAAVALLEPMAADKAVIARLDAVISAYSGEIGDLKSRVEGLDARLEELRKEAEGRFHESRGAAESFEQMNRERNQLIDRWNALAVQHNEALQQRREAADHWNQLVGQYNAMKFGAYRLRRSREASNLVRRR